MLSSSCATFFFFFFSGQGVDLLGIIKQLPNEGGRLPDFHLLAKTLEGAGERVEVGAVLPVLSRVSEELLNKDLCVYAGQQNALPLLITAAQRLSEVEGSSEGVRLALIALSRLLDGQPDLLSPPPGQLTEDIIVQDLPPNAATQALSALVKQYVNQAEVVAVGLHAVVKGCIKHEVNRQAFVSNGIVETVMDTLRIHVAQASVASAAADCLRALTLDDDVRVPFGKAHNNARMIVAEAHGLALLVASLKALQGDANAVPPLAATIARLAVRSEFCQEIMDLGGTAAALEAMAAHSNAAVVQQV